MWVYVPVEEDGKEPWLGLISRPKDQEPWHFDLVRHVDIRDIYDDRPFRDTDAVIALLEFQQQCTIYRPRTNVQPGVLAVRNVAQATKLSGDFDALLTGLPTRNSHDPIFAGLSFSSDALVSWYTGRTFATDYDDRHRARCFHIKDTQCLEFNVRGIGNIKIYAGTRLNERPLGVTLLTSATLEISFTKERSLDELYFECISFDKLVGFLVGIRGKPPVFDTWLKKKQKIGDLEIPFDGKLEIAGTIWKEFEKPHPLKCLHRKRSENEVKRIFRRFNANKISLLTRMHAVEFVRFFSSNLNDKFSVSMPVLEEYLKSRFTQKEEIDYLSKEKGFFDFIEKENNDELTGFLHKHVNIVKRKTPSLKTLIRRSVDYLNGKGFAFPLSIGDRISARRGHLFHATIASMTRTEALSFDLEIRAIAAILLLHTLDDLGINIRPLTKSYHALSYFRFFLKPIKETKSKGFNIGTTKTLTSSSKKRRPPKRKKT